MKKDTFLVENGIFNEKMPENVNSRKEKMKLFIQKIFYKF